MDNIIIFGASLLGEVAYKTLKDKANICFFVDNDKKKHNTFFCDLKVISPESLVIYKDYKIVIASMYYGEISNQLNEMGVIDNVYIFFCNSNNCTADYFSYRIHKVCDVNIYKNLIICKNESKQFKADYRLVFKSLRNIQRSQEIIYGEKNVLFFAYVFPPLGGSGIQRSLKFVKYLKKLGWNPIVVTSGDTWFPLPKDISMTKEIPNNISMIRIDHLYKSSESLSNDEAQEIINLIYGVVDNDEIMNNFLTEMKDNHCAKRKKIFCPDMVVTWVLDVLYAVDKLIDFSKINMIYTTSAPYSDNFLGYYLKAKHNIPWVADFRDEWTNNCMVPVNSNIEFRMEQNIVHLADAVINVTPDSTENCRQIFGLANNKTYTITNGYDDDDFKTIKVLKEKNKKFTIKHNGMFYPDHREPFTFLRAVNELISENKIDIEKLAVEFIGEKNPVILEKIVAVDKYHIVKIIPYMEHIQSLQNLNKADLLLLIIGSGNQFKSVAPGKLYEYINMKKNMLVLAPIGGFTDKVTYQTGTGSCYEVDDINGIKTYILECYHHFFEDKMDNSFNIEEIAKYSREQTTNQLINIFDDLCLNH